MTNQQQHWKQQVAERRAKLEHIRGALRVARERHLRTGSDTDEEERARLAERERHADEALTYAEEQLRSAGTVRITQSRAQLSAIRADIVRRMDYRRGEREKQIQLERQRCGKAPERHIETHLRNVFGRWDYRECAGDAEDKKTLARIDAELAEYDRLDAEQPGAA